MQCDCGVRSWSPHPTPHFPAILMGNKTPTPVKFTISRKIYVYNCALWFWATLDELLHRHFCPDANPCTALSAQLAPIHCFLFSASVIHDISHLRCLPFVLCKDWCNQCSLLNTFRQDAICATRCRTLTKAWIQSMWIAKELKLENWHKDFLERCWHGTANKTTSSVAETLIVKPAVLCFEQRYTNSEIILSVAWLVQWKGNFWKCS